MRKDKEYKSFLDDDSADYTVEVSADESKKKNSSVLSRQTKLIIVLAAFLAVIIPVYIFVLVPKLFPDDSGNGKTEAPVPHHEEVVISGKYIGMMPMLSEDKLSEVTIKNKVTYMKDGKAEQKYETWSMFCDTETKIWGIRNYKGISYDSSALITMLGYFTQMKVDDRIEFDSVDQIDMSAYGFDEASMPVEYTIICTDGKKYTVTMGNSTPTAAGYYAYFTNDKGEIRPTVYIIGNYYAKLINCSLYSLMVPTVTQLLDQKDYVPKHFAIYKGVNPYFEIKKLENDDLTNAETAKVSHLYTKINGVVHEYDASAAYSNLLYTVLQPGIAGNTVVYAKPDSLEEIPDDILLSFGIDKKNPYRQLLFEAKTMYASNQSYLANQWVMFSEKTKNANDESVYYAFNVSFDIIVEVSASAVEFIEYALSYYYESYIFLTPFYNVDYITVDSTKLPEEYVSSGLIPLKDTFTLKVESEEKLSDVIVESLGTSPIAPSSKITGLKNFAEYYKVLLSVSTQVEVPEDILSKIDLNSPHITITVKTLGGKTRVMNFYLYNSRHAYYTLDGLGVSYVRYADLVKLLDATDDLIKGRVVSSEHSSQDPNETPVIDDEKPTGISSTEIILIVVLVAVILVGGGIAAFMLIKSSKQNSSEKSSGKKTSPFKPQDKKKKK